jgi:hypothetical protein
MFRPIAIITKTIMITAVETLGKLTMKGTLSGRLST